MAINKSGGFFLFLKPIPKLKVLNRIEIEKNPMRELIRAHYGKCINYILLHWPYLLFQS